MARRLSYVGNGLVAAGALIGAGTVAALATGYEITLSPAMIHLLAFKGLGAMAIGLIIAGSWVGRKANQPAIPASPRQPELHGGFSEPVAADVTRDGTKVPTTKSDDSQK